MGMTLEEARARFARGGDGGDEPEPEPEKTQTKAVAEATSGMADRVAARKAGSWRPSRRYVLGETFASSKGEIRVLFGKHKGASLEEIENIDPTYIDWILETGLGAEDPVWWTAVAEVKAGRYD